MVRPERINAIKRGVRLPFEEAHPAKIANPATGLITVLTWADFCWAFHRRGRSGATMTGLIPRANNVTGIAFADRSQGEFRKVNNAIVNLIARVSVDLRRSLITNGNAKSWGCRRERASAFSLPPWGGRMSDEFETQLAALRVEVGAFVLEVLTRDNPLILDDMAAGLKQRLGSLTTRAYLDAGDARLLKEVRESLEDFNRQSPSLLDKLAQRRTGSADLGVNLSQPVSAEWQGTDRPPVRFEQDGLGPGLIIRRRAEPGADDRFHRYWPWLAATATLLLLLAVATVVYMSRPKTSDPTTAGRSSGNTEAETGARVGQDYAAASAETGWSALLATVNNWPDPKRSQTNTILCGTANPATYDCTFSSRRVVWTKDPKAASRAMEVVRDFLIYALFLRSRNMRRKRRQRM